MADDIARHIIEYEISQETDHEGVAYMAAPRPAFDWPDGYNPVPEPLGAIPPSSDPLPKADCVAITWTVAEHEALADVLTPGFGRAKWYKYDRFFQDKYSDKISKRAPASNAKRLGSYFLTTINKKKVLCFKSELHLNQDGIRTGEGKATLPVKDLFHQILDEVKPTFIITTGTAGATFPDHELGDVIITRSAKFKLEKEFRNEDFKDTQYKSKIEIPKKFIPAANKMMESIKDRLTEPPFIAPTKRYKQKKPIYTSQNIPDIKIDGEHFDEFLPILTTDYFEFGTSDNRLETKGCGVEMGDAVLGMVVEELKASGKSHPDWLVIRNASDPQINGEAQKSPINMQIHWAVWYYETYGYWTSINSALATWAIIAGLKGNSD